MSKGHQANARSGPQSRALRRSRKSGHQQHLGPENQDSQHMLNQPRGSFPDVGGRGCLNLRLVPCKPILFEFWGWQFHPLSGVECPKSLVLQCFLEGRPLNLGGEMSPPKFRGYGLRLVVAFDLLLLA